MSYESVRRENSVNIIIVNLLDHVHRLCKGRCGRDRMVVGFTTTCTINAYHI
jgi:hypothetical protein